ALAFATLFFAGAALSAGAGDALVEAMDDATTTETTGETAADVPSDEAPTEATPAEDPPAEAPPAADDTLPEPVEGETPGAPAAPDGPTEPSPGTPSTPGSGTTPPPVPDPGTGKPRPAPSSGEGSAPTPSEDGRPNEDPAQPLVTPHGHEGDPASRAVDPEVESLAAHSTIWLHRTLPDPTPPAKRLAPEFATLLTREAADAGVRWSTLLGALRAEGGTGRVPATRAEVRALARALAARTGRGEWEAFLALHGRTAYADRAQALARYDRAVGLRALVVGLDAAKRRIEERVLADPRLEIYAGGRSDVLAGRIDVRVLVLLRYLAEADGRVLVSSLQSGHRLYARPGVVSAHVYGLAVDVAALGDRAIAGNSQPGGLTERAVRNILLLPAEVRPQQVISLLGLGGPSFALANHADHIHVGY
ncbi:MAG: hypothetical protein ICV74_11040, partial [Thermoleophilia bacterium]|nr:hypothetical protein [Thermoleophilia bacterium]